MSVLDKYFPAYWPQRLIIAVMLAGMGGAALNMVMA